MGLEMINLIVILAVFVGLLYVIKMFVQKKNRVLGSTSKHIKIIDNGLSVSIGQRLSIVKVSNEYFLMTHGQNGVAFQKLNSEDLEANELKWEEEFKKNTSLFSTEALTARFGKKRDEQDEK